MILLLEDYLKSLEKPIVYFSTYEDCYSIAFMPDDNDEFFEEIKSERYNNI